MRVLHVSQPTTAGVAAYVIAACADQARRGWEVAVACPDGGDLARRLTGRGVPRLPWTARRAPGPDAPAEAAGLRRIIREFDPDVVHLHSSKAGLAGRLRRPDRPTIFQPHGWSWLAVRGPVVQAAVAWERTAARRADVLVCVGAGELLEGRDQGVRAPYRLIRNGVDLDRFRPANAAARRAARAALGLPAGVPLAVCPGRVTRQKGQDVLVRAWPLVRARCPAAELAIVGTGNLVERLRRRAGPGVRFVPPPPDLRPWLRAADVVVLPSRWEALALTALETLAVGRSLVACDVPGLSELVGPGLGALVPVGDAGALAAAVSARLLDPGLAAAEGGAAATAATAFGLDGTLRLLAGVTAGLGGTPVPLRGRVIAC